jgi:hypothetical protein
MGLGYQFNAFPLRELFNEKSTLLEGQKPKTLYLRTSSGNTYVLDDRGILNDIRTCRTDGGSAGEFKLEPARLADTTLEVGGRFEFEFAGGVKRTSTLKEIIATSHQAFHGDIEAKTGGRKNDIADEAAHVLNVTAQWQD